MNTQEQPQNNARETSESHNTVTILMKRRKEIEEKLASEEITTEERGKLEEFLIETKVMCEIEELTKENAFLLNKLENDTNLTEAEKVTIRATITRNQNRITELQEDLQQRTDEKYRVEANSNTTVTEGGLKPEQIKQVLAAAERYAKDQKVA